MLVPLSSLKKTGGALAILALGALALVPARGEDRSPASYFPLDLKRHWKYRLTLEVDSTKQLAVRDRTNLSAVKVAERDAVLVEERIENHVELTETYALEGDAILLLSTKAQGGAERISDPPRPYLVLSKLDSVGAVWSWTSTDGRESYLTTVTRKGLDKEGRDEIVVSMKGKVHGKDATRVATQDHTLTLVRGVGVTHEENAIVPPDEKHRTATRSELLSHDTGSSKQDK
ncbi:hypothetical protein HY251_08120 [bacterium]|nr:hypothetical protein [bacterium]